MFSLDDWIEDSQVQFLYLKFRFMQVAGIFF